jgi:acyl-CoA reductase-like NAD-dependent aldehyde dehydrogenase
MRGRAEEFARPVTLEMGKLFAESLGEVALSADILDYYATHAERFLAPEQLNPDSGEAVVESSPLGVLFGVQPWNFPYFQLARFAGPNLMAGNVVMVKHSGTVPQCAIAYEKLWREAGAPEGAYANLLISHDQVLSVIDDPRIRGVALTGGVGAARGVAEGAGKNVKKSTEAALVQLVKQVDEAVAHGATLVLGGQRVDRPGAFMQPTILTDIQPDNPVYREEFFGPVALFFRVQDEEAAIALANDSDYGLGGSVFTRDIERGKRVASRIETGMVFVNHPTWTASDLPFGGIKNSGYGRELSSHGIQEFINKKLVRVAAIDSPV